MVTLPVHSITARLVISLGLCLGLILSAVMLLDYVVSRQQILSQVETDSAAAIERVVADLEDRLAGIESNTRLVANILQRRQFTHAGLREILQDFVHSNPDINSATIAINPQRHQAYAPYHYSSDGQTQLIDLAEQGTAYWQLPWFTQAVEQGPLWVEPYTDNTGARQSMTSFAVPVMHKNEQGDEQLYAVISANVSLGKLQRYLGRLALGEHSYAMLFSRQGHVLGSGVSAQLAQHFRDIAKNPETAQTLAQLIAASSEGTLIRRDARCPEINGNCVVRISRLAVNQWPIAIMYSQDELLTPLRTFQWRLAMITLLTLLVITAALIWATRRLTRPLTSLATASREIAQGQLDTPLPVVSGRDEVAELVSAFGAMTQDLKTQMAALQKAAARRARLEGELDAAGDIQMAMLPQGAEAWLPCSGGTLWAALQPARSVGGDLYHYFETDTQMLIAVGDVSDKGVPAALFMARAITALQRIQTEEATAAQLLAKLNKLLVEGNENCMFLTLFLGILDKRQQTLRFASAGHCAPCLINAQGCQPVELQAGPALGLAADLHFHDNEIQLAPGDRLVVYSDGLEEAFDINGNMYGAERLHSSLHQHRREPLADMGQSVFQDIDTFTAQATQSDDMTLLLLDSPLKQACYTVAATDSCLSSIHQWLSTLAQPWALTDEELRNLSLLSEEIVSNVLAYGQLSSEDEIGLHLDLYNHTIVLQVFDGGMPFNPLQQAQRATLGQSTEDSAIGGLGVHLIEQISQRQQYAQVSGMNQLSVSIARSIISEE